VLRERVGSLVSSPQTVNTLLEAVQASLRFAGSFNASDAVRPAAILWADPGEQWKPIVGLLSQFMPQLLMLGGYAPEKKQGPAIWLRTVLEPEVRQTSFSELDWDDEAISIIYMPGVSRQQLRAAEDCPPELRPLIELQYRGTVWKQRNGRDWTVEAFLASSDGGLGLDIAGDHATRQAMLGALGRLATTPLDTLRGKRLEAEDFNTLMIGDPVRELLNWMGNPEAVRSAWDHEKWDAFCSSCIDTYAFSPESDGVLVAASKLGEPVGSWVDVWSRFTEAPASYPGIPDLLRRARPSTLALKPEYWPSETESDEIQLRSSLQKIADLPSHEACGRVLELEERHGVRRDWVWAKLGMCPLAFALEHLARLALVVRGAAGGHSVDEMAEQYRSDGYRADDAVLMAIAAVIREEDRAAVSGALRAMYLPWVDDSATRLQMLFAGEEFDALAASGPLQLEPGECLLFVDGLRFDLGERLGRLAETRGLKVSRSWRWAALPTVTATAKPAVMVVSQHVASNSTLVKDFAPQYGSDHKSLGSKAIARLLEERGVDKVDGLMLSAHRADACGWAESAQIDKLGHTLKLDMASQIEQQLGVVLDQIESLLSQGWKRIRVVTDHGWLLVPGGMEKTELPQFLTESEWARCASIKDTSHVDVPVFAWSWNRNERFAVAPGATAFRAGTVYAHGGISLQECVIPDLTFSGRVDERRGIVAIESISWAGLRCRITIGTEDALGMRAEVRARPGDEGSAKSPSATFNEAGQTSTLIEDDDLLGADAYVVVLDPNGAVLAQEATVIGGDR